MSGSLTRNEVNSILRPNPREPKIGLCPDVNAPSNGKPAGASKTCLPEAVEVNVILPGPSRVATQSKTQPVSEIQIHSRGPPKLGTFKKTKVEITADVPVEVTGLSWNECIGVRRKVRGGNT